MAERKGFEMALAEAAKKDDWRDWNGLRLIFADWLEERGDPQVEMLRHDWKRFHCVSKAGPSGGSRRQLWERTPEHLRRYLDIHGSILGELWVAQAPADDAKGRTKGLIGRINGQQILHFVPRSLKLVSYIPKKIEHHPGDRIDLEGSYYFTHFPTRGGRSYKLDTDKYPEGFAKMWLMQVQPDLSSDAMFWQDGSLTCRVSHRS